MDILIKITILALTSLILLVITRQHSAFAAPILGVAVAIVFVFLILPQITKIFALGKSLVAMTGLDGEIFSPMVKTVCICVLVKILGETCRDAGECALGAKIDMAGAVLGLICIMPLVERALKLISVI